MAPATPFAVALFYEPSLAAAFASGVKLPYPRSTIDIPYEEGVRTGVLLPLSHIHVDPNAPPPDAPDPLFTDPPLHRYIPLPSTIYASTTAIHPKNFDLADAFVRFQDYDPLTMVIPEPADGTSSSAILYGAGLMKPGGGLDRLRSIRVRRTSELKSVLRKEGPMLVVVEQLEQLQQAPEVYQLLQEKKDQGWGCRPDLKVLSSLASIATKMGEVHTTLLPRLRSQLRNKKRGRIVQRRIKVTKDNLKKVRRKVTTDVITRGMCSEIARVISRVHAKKPQKLPSYLMQRIDEWAPKLAADLSRAVVFV